MTQTQALIYLSTEKSVKRRQQTEISHTKRKTENRNRKKKQLKNGIKNTKRKTENRTRETEQGNQNVVNEKQKSKNRKKIVLYTLSTHANITLSSQLFFLSASQIVRYLHIISSLSVVGVKFIHFKTLFPNHCP